jgi:hypothetical protein
MAKKEKHVAQFTGCTENSFGPSWYRCGPP